jgi:hypothetical protein
MAPEWLGNDSPRLSRHSGEIIGLQAVYSPDPYSAGIREAENLLHPHAIAPARLTMCSKRSSIPPEAGFCGGNNSSLALHALRQTPGVEVAGLCQGVGPP